MGRSLQVGQYVTSSCILPESLRDSHTRLRQGLIMKWKGNTLILRTHILQLDPSSNSDSITYQSCGLEYAPSLH